MARTTFKSSTLRRTPDQPTLRKLIPMLIQWRLLVFYPHFYQQNDFETEGDDRDNGDDATRSRDAFDIAIATKAWTEACRLLNQISLDGGNVGLFTLATAYHRDQRRLKWHRRILGAKSTLLVPAVRAVNKAARSLDVSQSQVRLALACYTRYARACAAAGADPLTLPTETELRQPMCGDLSAKCASADKDEDGDSLYTVLRTDLDDLTTGSVFPKGNAREEGAEMARIYRRAVVRCWRNFRAEFDDKGQERWPFLVAEMEDEERGTTQNWRDLEDCHTTWGEFERCDRWEFNQAECNQVLQKDQGKQEDQNDDSDRQDEHLGLTDGTADNGDNENNDDDDDDDNNNNNNREKTDVDVDKGGEEDEQQQQGDSPTQPRPAHWSRLSATYSVNWHDNLDEVVPIPENGKYAW